MEGTPAIYQGRILSQMDKDNFRAYIYSQDGFKKIVNNWKDYESHMQTGIWFSTLPETQKSAKVEINEHVKKINTQKQAGNKK